MSNNMDLSSVTALVQRAYGRSHTLVHCPTTHMYLVREMTLTWYGREDKAPYYAPDFKAESLEGIVDHCEETLAKTVTEDKVTVGVINHSLFTKHIKEGDCVVYFEYNAKGRKGQASFNINALVEKHASDPVYVRGVLRFINKYAPEDVKRVAWDALQELLPKGEWSNFSNADPRTKRD